VTRWTWWWSAVTTALVNVPVAMVGSCSLATTTSTRNISQSARFVAAAAAAADDDDDDDDRMMLVLHNMLNGLRFVVDHIDSCIWTYVSPRNGDNVVLKDI